MNSGQVSSINSLPVFVECFLVLTILGGSKLNKNKVGWLFIGLAGCLGLLFMMAGEDKMPSITFFTGDTGRCFFLFSSC